MSVKGEVDRLKSAKSDIASAIAAKGVSVPSGTRLDGMAALIAKIPVMTESEAFLAAHPVGSYMETASGSSPSSHGGIWVRVEAAGRGALWRRTA